MRTTMYSVIISILALLSRFIMSLVVSHDQLDVGLKGLSRMSSLNLYWIAFKRLRRAGSWRLPPHQLHGRYEPGCPGRHHIDFGHASENTRSGHLPAGADDALLERAALLKNRPGKPCFPARRPNGMSWPVTIIFMKSTDELCRAIYMAFAVCQLTSVSESKSWRSKANCLCGC